MDFKNTIICGDCVENLRKLPPDSLACCITDPPYNYEVIGHNWNKDEIERRLGRVRTNKSTTLVRNLPYGSGLSGGVRNPAWYQRNRENILDYTKWTENWGEALYRPLVPGAFVFVFSSTKTVAHVQIALESAGFYARDIIVWRRIAGIPRGINISKKMQKSGDPDFPRWEGWHSCLRSEWEAVLVMQKPLINNYYKTLKRYGVGLFKAKDESGFKSNIFEGYRREAVDDFNTHPTVKPVELIKKLIDISVPTGFSHIVIDPFAGSGTTLVAAKSLDIDYLGIEINPDYVEIAKRRLTNTKPI